MKMAVFEKAVRLGVIFPQKLFLLQISMYQSPNNLVPLENKVVFNRCPLFQHLNWKDFVDFWQTDLESLFYLFATSEPPKYSNSNSPNLCFDFF